MLDLLCTSCNNKNMLYVDNIFHDTKVVFDRKWLVARTGDFRSAKTIEANNLFSIDAVRLQVTMNVGRCFFWIRQNG